MTARVAGTTLSNDLLAYALTARAAEDAKRCLSLLRWFMRVKWD